MYQGGNSECMKYLTGGSGRYKCDMEQNKKKD